MSSGISDVTMTSGISEVIVTGDDPVWLADFTRMLIEERLCACAQHFAPIRSIYRWQGDIEDTTEVRVALHTRTELVPELIERIEHDHPYEVPCILAISIDHASPAYVEWVRTQTGPESAIHRGPTPAVVPARRTVRPPRSGIRTRPGSRRRS